MEKTAQFRGFGAHNPVPNPHLDPLAKHLSLRSPPTQWLQFSGDLPAEIPRLLPPLGIA